MPIFADGNVNPASFGVPDLYVNVNAPPAAALPGAPADILGIVGTAIWGPKNSPVPVSDEAGAAVYFGPMQARKFDLMTQVRAAVMNGARNLRLVRATDGSDLASSATVQTNGGTATSRYTGSGGNAIQIRIQKGSAASTHKVTVLKPGLQPEVFDNIPGTANAAWVNIANAINNGATGRGRSEIITFTAGVSTTTPTYSDTAINFTGGTDGAATATAATLIGADTNPRTGMYALRDTGIAAFLLADCDDVSTWATQLAFGKSEMAEAFAVSPSGDTIATFTTSTGGVDDPFIKTIFGDWVYMFDAVNKTTRLVSPQGFLAGRKVALGPHQSLLNKPLYGIVGTQKSYAAQRYSRAELQEIANARGEVITMTSVGGDYPSARFGRNSSSDTARNGDEYTTYTGYLAKSFDQGAGLGRYVGRLITPEQIREAESDIGGFLTNEIEEGRAKAASVKITVPPGYTGAEKANVQVQYLEVLQYFIVDLTGGKTVEIVNAAPLAA